MQHLVQCDHTSNSTSSSECTSNCTSNCTTNMTYKDLVKCPTHPTYIDSGRASLNRKYAYSGNRHESTWIGDLAHLQQWGPPSALAAEITCKLRPFCTLIGCRQYHQISTHHFEATYQAKTPSLGINQTNNSPAYMERPRRLRRPM